MPLGNLSPNETVTLARGGSTNAPIVIDQPGVTLICPDGAGADHIINHNDATFLIRVTGNARDVTIQGLDIRGKPGGGTWTGIRVESGADGATIRGCTLQTFIADGGTAGYAIDVRSSGGALIEDCEVRIEAGQPMSCGGGGIVIRNWADGARPNLLGFTVRNCVIRGARGSGILVQGGGGLYPYRDVTIEDCLSQDNGDGIYVRHTNNLIIRRCTVLDSGRTGGVEQEHEGIAIQSCQSVILEECVSTGAQRNVKPSNGATYGGSGIHIWGRQSSTASLTSNRTTTNVTIRRCTTSGNTWAGVFISEAGVDGLLITQSLILEPATSAIYADQRTQNVTIQSCTLVGLRSILAFQFLTQDFVPSWFWRANVLSGRIVALVGLNTATTIKAEEWDYNAWWVTAGSRPAGESGAVTLPAAPNADGTLPVGSPARGVIPDTFAIDASTGTDRYGATLSPAIAPWDIGCIQHDAPVDPGGGSGTGEVTVVGAQLSTTGAAQSTGLTATLPAGVQSGDLLILAVCLRSEGSQQTPSGWTQVLVQNQNVANVGLALYRKVAGSSEPSVSYTATTSQCMAAVVLAVRGQDGTTPINVSASSSDDAADTSAPCPSVDPTVGQGALLVTMLACRGQVTHTPPAGHTERADGFSTFATANDNATIALGTEPLTTDAPTGTRTWTQNLTPFNSLASLVIAPGSGTLAAPTSPSATANGPQQITVSWANPTTYTSIEVRRAPSATGPWVVIATLAGTATSYANTGLQPSTTYHYQVRGRNGDQISDWSPTTPASAATPAGAPTSPSDLVATPGANQVSLAWTNGSGQTSLVVERAIGAGVETFSDLVTLGSSTATSYTDTGLTAGQTYRYRIRAVNSGGSVRSNTAEAVPTGAPAAATPTVRGTTDQATADAQQTQLQLETPLTTQVGDLLVAIVAGRDNADRPSLPSPWVLWAERAHNIAQLTIRAYTRIADAAGTQPVLVSAPDLQHLAGAILAVQGQHPSSYLDAAATQSNDTAATSTAVPSVAAVSASTLLIIAGAMRGQTTYTPPAGMTEVAEVASADGANSGNNVSLFAAVEPRAASGATGTRTVTHSWATAVYSVSMALTVAPAPALTAPAAVSNLAAALVGGFVVLTWTPAANAELQRIERSIDGGGTWVEIVEGLDGSEATYQDAPSSVAPNVTVRYRVYGSNAAGESAASNVAQQLTAPAGVYSLAVAREPATPSTALRLTWTAPGSAAASQSVERSADGAGGWGVIASGLAPGTATYLDSGRAAATAYFYRIVTVNAATSVAGNVAGETTAAAETPAVFLPRAAFTVPQRAQLLIRDRPREEGGSVLADLTPWLTECVGSTDGYGDKDLRFACRLPVPEALVHYLRRGALHVEVVVGDHVVWEGRITHPSLIAGTAAGFRATALGYWVAATDPLVVDLWSDTDLSTWVVATPADRALRTNARYEIRRDDIWRISLKGGATYSPSTLGSILYLPPDGGGRKITGLDVTINHFLPSSTYRVQVNRITGTTQAGTLTTVFTITGSGSFVSVPLSLDWSATPADAVLIEVFPSASVTAPGQDGDSFVEVVAARVKSGFTTSLDPAQIARDLVGQIVAANPGQLSPSTRFIEDTGADRPDARYEDVYPAEILQGLAADGAGDGPWEVGVGPGRALFFRPRPSLETARRWAIVAERAELSQSRTDLANRVYATYEDARGRTRRTAAAEDAGSRARYGLRRDRAVAAETSSLSQAQQARDAALADAATPPSEARWEIRRLTTMQGQPAPPWLVRAGHVVTEVGLGPSGDSSIDRLRTFRLAETRIDYLTGALSVTPEAAPPSLDQPSD